MKKPSNRRKLPLVEVPKVPSEAPCTIEKTSDISRQGKGRAQLSAVACATISETSLRQPISLEHRRPVSFKHCCDSRLRLPSHLMDRLSFSELVRVAVRAALWGVEGHGDPVFHSRYPYPTRRAKSDGGTNSNEAVFQAFLLSHCCRPIEPNLVAVTAALQLEPFIRAGRPPVTRPAPSHRFSRRANERGPPTVNEDFCQTFLLSD